MEPPQGFQNHGAWHACRDLKDILSQQSKVLFVDEPRMVRAAVVHFASEQDRDQARAVFRNSSILGNAVDIVPVRPSSRGHEHPSQTELLRPGGAGRLGRATVYIQLSCYPPPRSSSNASRGITVCLNV